MYIFYDFQFLPVASSPIGKPSGHQPKPRDYEENPERDPTMTTIKIHDHEQGLVTATNTTRKIQ
jgi:hypothetical protein